MQLRFGGNHAAVLGHGLVPMSPRSIRSGAASLPDQFVLEFRFALLAADIYGARSGDREREVFVAVDEHVVMDLKSKA